MRALIWVALGLGGACHLAVDLWLISLHTDTATMETPLAVAAASQFDWGPARLYGPFQSPNHRVLAHAPLYYRLTALTVLPAVRLGRDSLDSCLIGGRVISLIAFLGTLTAARTLAVVDGAPWHAGFSAACLTAMSWVIGNYAITLRPDMLAVCLQTTGIWLVQRSLADRRRLTGQLTAAYALFGLAVCVKQAALVGPLVSTGLLVRVGIRSPATRRAIALAHLIGLALVLGIYGAEAVWTSGMMARAVFVVPSALRRLAPGGWETVTFIMAVVSVLSLAPLTLGLTCDIVRPRRAIGEPIDWLLGLYLTAELALVVFLSYSNGGAWMNYAIQACVLVSVLAGRALGRVVDANLLGSRAIAVGLITVAVVLTDIGLLCVKVRNQRAEQAQIDGLMPYVRARGQPRREVYFVGLPQYNRLFGRVDLVHDEWLYEMYERLSAAEPRTLWLREALTTSVRLVVVPVDPPIIFPISPPVLPGLNESLPHLGYRLSLTRGRFRVWERPVRH